uniref:Uncharacterized protein n=1 Tax=Arundo donax TaxID=35708 RepID=A0A0A8YL45_ARUDO
MAYPAENNNQTSCASSTVLLIYSTLWLQLHCLTSISSQASPSSLLPLIEPKYLQRSFAMPLLYLVFNYM